MTLNYEPNKSLLSKKYVADCEIRLKELQVHWIGT